MRIFDKDPHGTVPLQPHIPPPRHGVAAYEWPMGQTPPPRCQRVKATTDMSSTPTRNRDLMLGTPWGPQLKDRIGDTPGAGPSVAASVRPFRATPLRIRPVSDPGRSGAPGAHGLSESNHWQRRCEHKSPSCGAKSARLFGARQP